MAEGIASNPGRGGDCGAGGRDPASVRRLPSCEVISRLNEFEDRLRTAPGSMVDADDAVGETRRASGREEGRRGGREQNGRRRDHRSGLLVDRNGELRRAARAARALAEARLSSTREHHHALFEVCDRP